jgi:hypothetical protein
MIPDRRDGSNQKRTVWYTCQHRFVYTGNVVVKSRCPACGAPMGGRE